MNHSAVRDFYGGFGKLPPGAQLLHKQYEIRRASADRKDRQRKPETFDPSQLLDEGSRPVWNNGIIPIALRLGGRHPIYLRIRYAPGNRAWLKDQPRNKEPVWDKSLKCWELPPSRFNELIAMVLARFGSTYILQPCREREVCAPSCQNAEGFECQCSCLGAHHGEGHGDGWFAVSEAFAVRYGKERLGCRLLRGRDLRRGGRFFGR